MEYQNSGSQIIIRLVKGELVTESLNNLVKELNLKGGFFVGLGAFEKTTLGYYSLSEKTYLKKTFDESLEVTNFTGNISYLGDELIIHAHVTLSNQDMNAFGGHFVEATVSGTFEAILIPTSDLIRQKDEELGLNLLKLTNFLPKS